MKLGIANGSTIGGRRGVLRRWRVRRRVVRSDGLVLLLLVVLKLAPVLMVLE